MTYDVRWKQRFENFDRAVDLLRQPVERGVDTLSDLEKGGTIQRFEMVFELSWKLLKDYLEHEGAVIAPVTPRNVIKEAFSARILTNGQVWIDMLDRRNLLSHTYDEGAFSAAVREIDRCYLDAIEELRSWFRERAGA